MKHPARWIALAVAVVVVVFGGGARASTSAPTPNADAQHEPARRQGGARRSTSPTLDGGRVTDAADSPGKTVIVNFWNIWCVPCRQELPALQHVLRRAHRTTPTSRWSASCATHETTAASRSYVNAEGMDWTLALDPGDQAALDFATRGQPETLRDRPERRGRRVVMYGPVDRADARTTCSRRRAGVVVSTTPRAAGPRGSRSRSSSWSRWRSVVWPRGDAVAGGARPRRSRPQLKCPECEGLSVADSQAPTSRAIRADIKRRIAARSERRRDPPGLRRPLRRVDPAHTAGLGHQPARVGPAGGRARARRHRDRASRSRRNRREPQLHATDADEQLVDEREHR